MTSTIENIWKFDLRHGNSPHPSEGACLLDAVSWFEYGRLGDHPPCVCAVIAAFARVANDTMTDTGRQRLKVFLYRVPGTVDPAAEWARAEYLVWQAIRVFAPMALDAIGEPGEAKELRKFSGTFAEFAERPAFACTAAARRSAIFAHADRVTQITPAMEAGNAARAAKYAILRRGSSLTALEDAIVATLYGVLRIGRQAELEPWPEDHMIMRVEEFAAAAV